MSGAVITVGDGPGDFAGYWGGDHHDGVPIFVPTIKHLRRPLRAGPLHHRRNRGLRAAGQLAAGDRDVMLHGAYTAQECLKAGVLDIIDIQLRPVSSSARAATVR